MVPSRHLMFQHATESGGRAHTGEPAKRHHGTWHRAHPRGSLMPGPALEVRAGRDLRTGTGGDGSVHPIRAARPYRPAASCGAWPR